MGVWGAVQVSVRDNVWGAVPARETYGVRSRSGPWKYRELHPVTVHLYHESAGTSSSSFGTISFMAIEHSTRQ